MTACARRISACSDYVNLYFRLLLTICKGLGGAGIKPGDSIEPRLRVMPNDLDLNGHMNNGRCPTIVDLGLATLFIRSGFARLCFAKGWRPMGGGSIVYFRRGLTLFQRYTLRLTPVGWDEFWNYIRFEFTRNGEICATGFMKDAAASGGGLVPNAGVYQQLAHALYSPPLLAVTVAR